jgi:hypothetical protein
MFLDAGVNAAREKAVEMTPNDTGSFGHRCMNHYSPDCPFGTVSQLWISSPIRFRFKSPATSNSKDCKCRWGALTLHLIRVGFFCPGCTHGR